MPVAGGRGLTACNSAVGVAAITDLMDGDGVIRLFEDRAVVADAQPEQPFELAAERLHLADAGGDVAMNGCQNVEGGMLLNRANFSPNIRVEANFLHWFFSFAPVVADLVHREAALRDHLLKGKAAFRVLPEIVTRGSDGAAVFRG